MKTFLLTSVIAMLAAGIYGTIDLTFDVKNGTLIQYEDDEDLPTVTQFAEKSKWIFTRPQVKIARKEKKAPVGPTLINSFSDISFEDFSRGEPPGIYEAMLFEEVGQPDSLMNTDVATAISDTISAIHEKTKSDSLAAKKEKRKFNVKLFSRSRPRPIIKEEVALEERDTTRSN